MSKIKDFFKKLGKNIVESADAANPEYKIAEEQQNKTETQEEPVNIKVVTNKYVPGELLEDLVCEDDDTYIN